MTPLDAGREYMMLAPDLSVLREGRRPAPALPMEVFGPFWDTWIKAGADAAGAPVDYVAAPLLATASAIIGNARWVTPWRGWNEPPVLWICSVGTPSSSKSPGADPVLGLCRDLESEMAEGFESTHRDWQTRRTAAKVARENWEADVRTAVKNGAAPPLMPPDAVDPVEPARPRLLASDATTEAMAHVLASDGRGLLFSRDELAGWLGLFDKYGGAGGDRAFWVEAYGGRPFVVDRVKHNGKPIRVSRLAVAIFGGIQPERLNTALLKGEDDGLPARFLWSWPESLSPKRPTLIADSSGALAVLRRLRGLRPVPTEKGELRPFFVPLAEDAAAIFQKWREEHHGEDASGMLASAFGKAPGHVLRLALVLEFLWWAAEPAAPEPGHVSARDQGRRRARRGLLQAHGRTSLRRRRAPESGPPRRDPRPLDRPQSPRDDQRARRAAEEWIARLQGTRRGAGCDRSAR
ncbi:MAG: DUF3987 domain-containing protein [Alphaproteobacteria bacterium]